MDPSLFVLPAAVIVAVFAVITRNSMVHARAKVYEAQSGIDVQLRLRHDLVPRLIELVSGYAEHEQTVLEAVAVRRNSALEARDPERVETAENSLAAGMGELLALAERHPGLKASGQFHATVDELSAIEDELQAAREIHNANARAYNSRSESFPTVLVAMFMRPRSFAYLRIETIDTGRLGSTREAAAA